MRLQDLERALEIAKKAAVEAGEKLLPYFGNIEYENKRHTGDNIGDVVTKLDRQTERFLAQELAKFDPSVGFRGEEFGVQKEADTTWLVDPIDGTANFIRGLPLCTTMIALLEDNKAVLSIINDFVRQETYWAIRGQGAFCNGKAIHVSSRNLKDGLLSFETHTEKPENVDIYLKLRSATSLISTMNCGNDFAMVASGKLDGRIAIDPYGMDWDFAPGSLMVSEAGGVAVNIGETTYDYRNHDYLIVNPVIYKELTNGPDALFPLNV